MERFYVYTHAKQDTGEVFYVGKGEARRHLSRCSRSDWWKRTVAKHGLKSEIIERFADEADAFAMERYLIASYRSLGTALINMTDGGEGAAGRSMSPEHRRRISEAQKARPRDPAQGAAHSACLTGRRHSEETKRKIGAKSLGRKLTPEHRAKITGRPRKETKEAAHG